MKGALLGVFAGSGIEERLEGFGLMMDVVVAYEFWTRGFAGTMMALRSRGMRRLSGGAKGKMKKREERFETQGNRLKGDQLFTTHKTDV